MEGNSKQDIHFNRTSWSLSNVIVQSQIGEQENVFEKKPSCTVQHFFVFRWIMMLFAKIRTLMTSALWIQALLRTRLMFQSSFVHYAETRFLISSANRKAFFLAMETLAWSKCSEILDITEISIKYFVFALIPPKSTVPLGVHIAIRTTL